MKVDFSQEITSLDGSVLQSEGAPLTLGQVAVQALLSNHDEDRVIDGAEKVRRFRLAETAFQSGEASLTVEDVSLLKRLIARQFVTLVCARAWALLEQE